MTQCVLRRGPSRDQTSIRLSAAISIGSGGPFGAEGPIIMTGGAIGSMISQLFKLTATERKTLLVAGAALLIRSVERLQSLDLGFDPQGVTTVQLLTASPGC